MPPHFGDRFAQRINEATLYFTHYALFEEPDDDVPEAVYIDAATGQVTQEFTLTAPISERVFTRRRPNPTVLAASSETSKLLPYFVDPPGFPPLPAPGPVVGVIAAATGLPANVAAANTKVLLVAMGQFLAEGATTGRLTGAHFEVEKLMRFAVQIRVGFVFKPPANVPAPSVGVLVGWLDYGLLHQLINLPPPPNATERVRYEWKAQMTLSTDGKYVRPIAGEPRPVADAFDPALTEIRFEGERVDEEGHYAIVGSASHVQLTAPPAIVQFLFGTTSLSDVEFAAKEEGTLVAL